MKDYEDIWYKPWTWNPISAPFGYAFLILFSLLAFAAVGQYIGLDK